MITSFQIHLNNTTGSLSKCLLSLRKKNFKPLKYHQKTDDPQTITLSIELESETSITAEQLSFLKDLIPAVRHIEVINEAVTPAPLENHSLPARPQNETTTQRLYRGQSMGEETPGDLRDNTSPATESVYRGQHLDSKEGEEIAEQVETENSKKKQQYYRGQLISEE